MKSNDDGRRKMPKLKCPYCNKRVIDLPNKEFKNTFSLVKANDIEEFDAVLKCLHCGKIIGFRLPILKSNNINAKCIPILK